MTHFYHDLQKTPPEMSFSLTIVKDFFSHISESDDIKTDHIAAPKTNERTHPSKH